MTPTEQDQQAAAAIIDDIEVIADNLMYDNVSEIEMCGYNKEIIANAIAQARQEGKNAAMEKADENHARLKMMMPLFLEARDAICAIPWAAARLHNLDFTLADRMDAVGNDEQWKQTYADAIRELKEPTDG